MPTQEDRVLIRIKVVRAYIRDRKEVSLQELYSYGLVNLGIRDRTMAGYLKALEDMEIVKRDLEKLTVTWTGDVE